MDELAAADEDELLLLLLEEVADAVEATPSIVKSGEMLRVEPIVSK